MTEREKEMERYKAHLQTLFEPYKLLREIAYDLMLLTFAVKDLQEGGKCGKVKSKK